MTTHGKNWSAPLALTAQHDVQSFDCGKAMLNTWLQRYAMQAQGSGSARVFVLTQPGHKPAATASVSAYYALTVGQIDALEAPTRARQGMGRYPIPLVVLARLAVDLLHQGQGLGAALLQDAVLRTLAIADQAGIRALLVHPLDEAAERFYARFGFEPSPLREQQQLLLLKDARQTIAKIVEGRAN